MKRVNAIITGILLWTAVLRCDANAQSVISDFEYSQSRPIQAIDLNTPIRFKPVLGIELGFVSLVRNTPDSQPFVFDQDGNTLLNMDDMRGDPGIGFDSVVNLYNLFSDHRAIDLNFRYFSSGNMSYDESVRATQVTPVFYSGIPVSPSGEERFEYESKLDSTEFNVGVRLLPRTRLIAGFRHLRLEERFDITEVINSTTTGYFSSTNNRLYGGQVGIEATPISNNWGQLSGSVKYAFCNDNIGGNASAADASGSPISTTVSGDSDATILDLQLGGTLFLTRSLSLYSGYQGLLLEDIATAPDQIVNATIFSPLNNPTLGDAQFHGFAMRFVGVW